MNKRTVVVFRRQEKIKPLSILFHLRKLLLAGLW